MKKCTKIIIAKNRGWRGLAEVKLLNEDDKEIASQIFSFSQHVWNDLLIRNVIVVQDDDSYFVIHFTPSDKLPGRDQQRSVLIKNVTLTVTEVNKYSKATGLREISGDDYYAVYHYTRNTNNHTTSDWNYIGLRVIPEI